MNDFTRASTPWGSVGIVGTYWKDGSRNADAGGVGSGGCGDALPPDLAIGTERCVEDGSREVSLWLGGEVVGAKEEFVSITLWNGYSCISQPLSSQRLRNIHEHHYIYHLYPRNSSVV